MGCLLLCFTPMRIIFRLPTSKLAYNCMTMENRWTSQLWRYNTAILLKMCWNHFLSCWGFDMTSGGTKWHQVLQEQWGVWKGTQSTPHRSNMKQARPSTRTPATQWETLPWQAASLASTLEEALGGTTWNNHRRQNHAATEQLRTCQRTCPRTWRTIRAKHAVH